MNGIVAGTRAAGAKIDVGGDLTNAKLDDAGTIYTAATMSDLNGKTISNATQVTLSGAAAVTHNTGVTLADTAKLTYTNADLTLGAFADATGTELTLTAGKLTLNDASTIAGKVSAVGLENNAVLGVTGDVTGLTGTYTGNADSEFIATGKATGFTIVELSAAGSKFSAASTGTLTHLAMSATSEYTQDGSLDLSGLGGTRTAGAAVTVTGNLDDTNLATGLKYTAATMNNTFTGDVVMNNGTSVELSGATAGDGVTSLSMTGGSKVNLTQGNLGSGTALTNLSLTGTGTSLQAGSVTTTAYTDDANAVMNLRDKLTLNTTAATQILGTVSAKDLELGAGADVDASNAAGLTLTGTYTGFAGSIFDTKGSNVNGKATGFTSINLTDADFTAASVAAAGLDAYTDTANSSFIVTDDVTLSNGTEIKGEFKSGGLTANNNLTLAGTADVTSTENVTVTGTFAANSGSELDAAGKAIALHSGGTITGSTITGSTLTSSGNVLILDGTNTIDADLTANNGLTLLAASDSTVTGDVAITGTFTDATDSTLSATGTATLNSAATITGTFESGGLLTTKADLDVTGSLTAVGLTNSGAFDGTGATALDLTGTYTGLAGSTFTATGKDSGFTGIDLENAGTGTFSAQSTDELTSFKDNATSTFNLSGAATFADSADVTIKGLFAADGMTNKGTVIVNTGADISGLNDTYTGTGTSSFTSNVDTVFTGINLSDTAVFTAKSIGEAGANKNVLTSFKDATGTEFTVTDDVTINDGTAPTPALTTIAGSFTTGGKLTAKTDVTVEGMLSATDLDNDANFTVDAGADIDGLTGTYTGNAGSSFTADGKATGFTEIDLTNGGSFSAASVAATGLDSYQDAAGSTFTVTVGVRLNTGSDVEIKGSFTSGNLLTANDNVKVTGSLSTPAVKVTADKTFDASGKDITGLTTVDLGSGATLKFGSTDTYVLDGTVATGSTLEFTGTNALDAGTVDNTAGGKIVAANTAMTGVFEWTAADAWAVKTDKQGGNYEAESFIDFDNDGSQSITIGGNTSVTSTATVPYELNGLNVDAGSTFDTSGDLTIGNVSNIEGTLKTGGHLVLGNDMTVTGSLTAVGITNGGTITFTGGTLTVTSKYTGNAGSEFNAADKATGFTEIDLSSGGSFRAASVAATGLISYQDAAGSTFTVTDAVTLNNNTTINGTFSAVGLNNNAVLNIDSTADVIGLTDTYTSGGTGSEFIADGKATGFTEIDLSSGGSFRAAAVASTGLISYQDAAGSTFTVTDAVTLNNNTTINGTFSAVGLNNNAVLNIDSTADVIGLTGKYTGGGTAASFTADGKATGFTEIDLSNGGSFSAASVAATGLDSYQDATGTSFTVTDGMRLSADTTINGTLSVSANTLTTDGNVTVVGSLTAGGIDIAAAKTFDASGKDITGLTTVDLGSGATLKFGNTDTYVLDGTVATGATLEFTGTNALDAGTVDNTAGGKIVAANTAMTGVFQWTAVDEWAVKTDKQGGNYEAESFIDFDNGGSQSITIGGNTSVTSTATDPYELNGLNVDAGSTFDTSGDLTIDGVSNIGGALKVGGRLLLDNDMTVTGSLTAVGITNGGIVTVTGGTLILTDKYTGNAGSEFDAAGKTVGFDVVDLKSAGTVVSTMTVGELASVSSVSIAAGSKLTVDNSSLDLSSPNTWALAKNAELTVENGNLTIDNAAAASGAVFKAQNVITMFTASHLNLLNGTRLTLTTDQSANYDQVTLEEGSEANLTGDMTFNAITLKNVTGTTQGANKLTVGGDITTSSFVDEAASVLTGDVVTFDTAGQTGGTEIEGTVIGTAFILGEDARTTLLTTGKLNVASYEGKAGSDFNASVGDFSAVSSVTLAAEDTGASKAGAILTARNVAPMTTLTMGAGSTLNLTNTDAQDLTGKLGDVAIGANINAENADLTGTAAATKVNFTARTFSDVLDGAAVISNGSSYTATDAAAGNAVTSLNMSNGSKLNLENGSLGTTTALTDLTLAGAGTELKAVDVTTDAFTSGVGTVTELTGTLTIKGDSMIAGTLSGTTTQTGGTLNLAATAAHTGNFVQNAGTLNTANGATLNDATFKGDVNPSGTLNILGNATFDGAEVDFGLLKDGNNLVVGGHVDLTNASMEIDISGASTGHYTLAQYGSMTQSGIQAIGTKGGTGEERGDVYINAAGGADTALIYDLIVGNTTLYWYGTEGKTRWSADITDNNWTDNYILTHFKTGDDVVFNDKAPNKNVDIASTIKVGTMNVTAEGYIFNIDLDAEGSITADQFTNTGGATVVVTKEDDSNLSRNKTQFTVLSGSGADAFADNMQWSSTNSRIKYDLFSDPDALGYWLWLMNYADEYGSRLSPNGKRMAGLIDNLPSDNAFLAKLDSLTDDAAILSGIENATGEGYAMSMHGTVKLQQVFNDYLLARKTFTGGDQKRVILGQCDPCGPVCGSRSNYELWGQFTGGSHDRSNIGRYSGHDLSNYGVAFGVERNISKRWFGGVAFGYDNANLKLDDRHAKDEFEAFRASLYGGYAGRSWYASGYVGYSKNWHDMKRSNPVLGFSNRGKYDDDVFSTGLELGRVMKLQSGAQFIPSIGIHWIHLDNPSFSERGNTASALRLSKSHYDSVRLPIGARLNRTFTTSRGLCPRITWTPELRAFYVAELADTRAGLNTAFASSLGSGSVFADSGSSGRSGGMFGIGVTAQLTTRLSVGIDYDYEVWEYYDRHNLTGNVTVRW